MKKILGTIMALAIFTMGYLISRGSNFDLGWFAIIVLPPIFLLITFLED